LNLKSKKITRSIRISLDLDEQIEEHQQSLESESYTQAMLHLVTLGLQAIKFKLEIKENPEKEQEIRKSYDSMLNKLTDEKTMSESFAILEPNQLVALKEMIAIEEDTRERKRLKEEELERNKRQEENKRRIEQGYYNTI
jgi:hypothetical protein